MLLNFVCAGWGLVLAVARISGIGAGYDYAASRRHRHVLTL